MFLKIKSYHRSGVILKHIYDLHVFHSGMYFIWDRYPTLFLDPVFDFCVATIDLLIVQ